MLISLVGLFIACVIFACIGTAVLTIVPKLRPTLVNVAMFVLGAVPISAASALCYGRIFGNETGELNPNAVLGLFVVLSVAGCCGGLLSVFAYRWLTRAIPLQRDSGSRMSR
jgi:hypothetical protein